MKVLIDMNLSPRWLEFLTKAGLQAAHWSEFGAGDASDLNILAFAQEHLPPFAEENCSRQLRI
jgi:predicted nuclease of predicted toxin-antitoxin system